VVNGCFGGFGVSEQGAEWLLANGAGTDKVSVTKTVHGGYASTYVNVDLLRHDPLLVRMVETLGEKANGDHAKLYVREIEQPLYRIDEYDGSESVEEPADVHWNNATINEE